MTSLYETLRDRARKRALYNRTVAELTALPLNMKLDLDIYQGDVPSIAHRAVYGN